MAEEAAEAPTAEEPAPIGEKKAGIEPEEVKSTDWDDDDDDDDDILLVDGENLLKDFQDHFSLPKESCLVRSRKKGNEVRV